MKKSIGIQKIIVGVVCFVSFAMWLGAYTRTHGSSLLMSLMILFMISETFYALLKRTKDIEDVPLDKTKKASIVKRLMALVVDYLILNICSFIVTSFFELSPNVEYSEILRDLFIGFIQHPIVFIVYLLYFGLFESSKLQATPAKLLFHLKVQSNNGTPINATQSFYRQLGKVNEIFALPFYLIINLISMVKRKDGKTLHDFFGDSMVVNS